MSKLLARRHRVLRARDVQHAVAVADTVRARDEANAIHHNAERLKRVRAELFKGDDNHCLGGSFAAYRELADRLEQAGRQLEGALYDARRKVSEKDEVRIGANRDREIAERLRNRAREAAEEAIEARIAALPYRRMQMMEGESS